MVEVVFEVINRVVQGLLFEVVYYFMVGWLDFVVKVEDVEVFMVIFWIFGIRVKMVMEIEDFLWIIWFQGIVFYIYQEIGLWCGFFWKQFQV